MKILDFNDRVSTILLQNKRSLLLELRMLENANLLHQQSNIYLHPSQNCTSQKCSAKSLKQLFDLQADQICLSWGDLLSSGLCSNFRSNLQFLCQMLQVYCDIRHCLFFLNLRITETGLEVIFPQSNTIKRVLSSSARINKCSNNASSSASIVLNLGEHSQSLSSVLRSLFFTELTVLVLSLFGLFTTKDQLQFSFCDDGTVQISCPNLCFTCAQLSSVLLSLALHTGLKFPSLNTERIGTTFWTHDCSFEQFAALVTDTLQKLRAKVTMRSLFS
ncbi:hypothetical protein GEMRC1_006476 [Eukaryota sp. GEM-RC1]